ncbi:MAG: preprotein translocase subunit SecE [Eggerthellaceae bacterium]|nr:preprotein translocase subunit SecE [Eggerthellaceae bacterium]
MAKKSKTQRAKASAARQQRKADRENGVLEEVVEETQEEKPAKVNIFKKSDDEQLKAEKKAEKKAKKVRFKFLKEVKAELKRVTWPSRSDVLRWTGVVVIALIFFGLFVGLLDNVIITPLLVLISGIGA